MIGDKSVPDLSNDISNCIADILKAKEVLGYEPGHSLSEGLDEAIDWYVSSLGD